MSHLSDEAVAACADGVLRGHAHDRALRHIADCPECAAAVRGQREATFALRAATTAPALPTDLFDRLRGLPAVTPVPRVPTRVEPDGSTMFSTAGAPLGAAAIVPASPPAESTPSHRGRMFMTTTAAVVALAGALAVGSAQADGDAPVNRTGTTVDEQRDSGGSGTQLQDTTDSTFVSVPLFRPTGN